MTNARTQRAIDTISAITALMTAQRNELAAWRYAFADCKNGFITKPEDAVRATDEAAAALKKLENEALEELEKN